MIVMMPTQTEPQKIPKSVGCKATPHDGKATAKVSPAWNYIHYLALERSTIVASRLGDDSGERVPSRCTITYASPAVVGPKGGQLASGMGSCFRATRFALNGALPEVKPGPFVKQSKPAYEAAPWNFESPRIQWIRNSKVVLYYFLIDHSDGAYSSGSANKARVPFSRSNSKKGRRNCKRVGYHQFNSDRKDDVRVGLNTGSMGFDRDPIATGLPSIGALQVRRSVTGAERYLVENAHFLGCPNFERWWRPFVPCQYSVRKHTARTNFVALVGKERPCRYVRVCARLGLISPATISQGDGNTIIHAPHRTTNAERRMVGASLLRRFPLSHQNERAEAELAQLDRRAMYIDYETTNFFTGQLMEVDSEVKIEVLHLPAMERSRGRRAFRRSIPDSGIRAFRPRLDFKMERKAEDVVPFPRSFSPSVSRQIGWC